MKLMTNLDSGAKMVFKIRLEGDSSVKIQLVSINKDYVKKYKQNDFNFFVSEDSNFVIWSTQDFIFNERQIRLPDDKNIKDLMVCTYKFDHDIHRYDSLKKMYDTLQEWADDMDLKNNFNNNIKNKNKKQKVIVAGDYWFIT